MRGFFSTKTFVAGFLALTLIGLGACTTVQKRPTYADLTFQHLPKIKVNVATINVQSTYQPTLAAPYVEHNFPVDLSRTAQRWAMDRLEAVGASGTMTVNVIKASVTETKLAKQGGVSGFFTEEQTERYDGELIMHISAEDPATLAAANAQATIQRSRTAAEGLTLNQREALWYDLSEQMMTDLNKQMEENLKQHMSAFVQ